MVVYKIINYGSLFMLFFLLALNLLREAKSKNRIWSLLIGFVGFAFKLFLGFFVFGTIYEISYIVFLYHPIRWIPGWHLGLVCLLVADLSYYLAHYISHKFDILWRTHALHHSDKEVVFETHFRHSLTSMLVFLLVSILTAWTFNLGIGYIGFYLGVIGLFQLLMHSPKWIWPKCWGLLFILPQIHRYHHTFGGQEKNFGGLFSIWDRMFGTYSEQAFEPIFGIKEGHHPQAMRGILWYEDPKS